MAIAPFWHHHRRVTDVALEEAGEASPQTAEHCWLRSAADLPQIALRISGPAAQPPEVDRRTRAFHCRKPKLFDANADGMVILSNLR